MCQPAAGKNENRTICKNYCRTFYELRVDRQKVHVHAVALKVFCMPVRIGPETRRVYTTHIPQGNSPICGCPFCTFICILNTNVSSICSAELGHQAVDHVRMFSERWRHGVQVNARLDLSSSFGISKHQRPSKLRSSHLWAFNVQTGVSQVRDLIFVLHDGMKRVRHAQPKKSPSDS